VALNKTFLGRDGIDDWSNWLVKTTISHKCLRLEDLLWTPELEYAIGRFSISKFLNICDDCDEDEKEWLWEPDNGFVEIFLNYLEGMVRNPWHKIKYQLQLLIMIRKNMTFITTIPYVIWNTPHLPSTIPPVEKNLPS
jgi:hypothetical protein